MNEEELRIGILDQTHAGLCYDHTGKFDHKQGKKGFAFVQWTAKVKTVGDKYLTSYSPGYRNAENEDERLVIVCQCWCHKTEKSDETSFLVETIKSKVDLI